MSNALNFALAPRISLSTLAPAAGTVLRVTCEPRISTDPDRKQTVLLLFDDAPPLVPDSITSTTKASTLHFTVPNLAARVYTLRLRVEGVDSIPVVYRGEPPQPAFDPAQQVTVP